MERNVVILSGGLDSTAVLYWVCTQHGDATAISFRYGQRHEEMELKAARAVVAALNVPHITVDLSSVYDMCTSSLMADSPVTVPDGTYEEQAKGGRLSTEVPLRNPLFIMAAAAWAKSMWPHDSITVWTGIHNSDCEYPDCSTATMDTLEKVLFHIYGYEVSLRNLGDGRTKAELLQLSGLPEELADLTYSCYKGGGKPCGRCATCLQRQEAFLYAYAHKSVKLKDIL